MNPPTTRHPKRAKPLKGSAPPTPLEQLTTVKEAARILAVCEKTVRRWIHRGVLPRAKGTGRAVRIRVRDVRALTWAE